MQIEYLNKGDKVAIVSIAKYISNEECDYAYNYITNKGYKVVSLNKTILKKRGMFSGTDQERIQLLQDNLDNPKVKAIFFARGGYGSIRIIDKIDFTKFLIKPKWLIGFSDITVFLSHISSNYNCNSIHASMPINYSSTLETAKMEIFNLLSGVKNPIKIPFNKYNTKGVSKGKLIGGNLSVLCSILNSNSFPKTTGNILIIEDVDEYLYSIERMMYTLKRSGVLKNISGLIVGEFSKIKDNKPKFGKNIYQLINQFLIEYKYPVCFNFPVGHIKNNTPIIMNHTVKLSVGKNVELFYLD